jgi:asparagine synthase (glutamine-hydrolysing)
MFAFAIDNRHSETLTLARDRFGEKPLYYTVQDGHVLIASEMKALMLVCDNLQVNHQRLSEWSLHRNVDFGSPETLVANLFSLPPGHLLKIRQGHIEPPYAYYAPESLVDPERYERFSRQSSRALTAEIEALLEASVQARLVSDVPLGTLCSGGLDSSLITALSRRHRKAVSAFHVSVAGYEKFDESGYARQVADRLEGETFRRNLPRTRGVITLLSGEGADELFGGYNQRYRRYRQFLRLKRALAHLPAKLRNGTALAGYACDGVPITAFSEYEGLLVHSTAFLDRFARESLRLRCAEAYRFVANDTERLVLGALLADATNFLTPLLRRLDRMSMAASIECRVPFLDHQLVNTVLHLPLSARLGGPRTSGC